MSNLWRKIKEFFSNMSNFYIGAAAFCSLCAVLGFFVGETVVGITWTLCAIVNLYFANTEE